ETQEFYANSVLSDEEILQKEFSELIQKYFIKIFEQIDEERHLSPKEKLFYARFFSYGCSAVLVNCITNENEESPMEIAMQLLRLAKDTELYSYSLYAKE
ncbi:TetR-like C-terminal domain-containing protein, partial [Enterococcus faecium]|uniref:TetR-like C-terminal domain-containing protein n=1 Tax=Enterococcus faecium TaxID=1352 RepID=UPI0031CCE511